MLTHCALLGLLLGVLALLASPSTDSKDAPYVVAYRSIGEPVAVWEYMQWSDGAATVLFRGDEVLRL